MKVRICGEASSGQTTMEPRRRVQMSPSFIPAAERQQEKGGGGGGRDNCSVLTTASNCSERWWIDSPPW